MTELKQYVLRYWETEFPDLKPQKNRAGNRVYREKDVKLIKEIMTLLYEHKFTIEGARQKLKDDNNNKKNAAKRISSTGQINLLFNNEQQKKVITELKQELKNLINLLSE
ncbi:MerR family transcriptional regulator [candidate division KSB1 bacterium]